MFLLFAIAFLLKRNGSHAVPLPASTPASSVFEANIFARDDPTDGSHRRTVLSILWSCLATTFACTWVSVHPNVPFKGEGKWTLLRRRIFLMFFSILTPEFMVVWAFKQWRGAVMIAKAVNKAIGVASRNRDDPTRESWTTTHGHFLQMGGFRFSITQTDNIYYRGMAPALRSLGAEHSNETNERDHLSGKVSERSKNDGHQKIMTKQMYCRHETLDGSWSTDYTISDDEPRDNIWEGILTSDALTQLLSEDLIIFPTITVDEINDKSKGDALSKGIALLQLTWFIVQILSRAALRLPISELELTTAALAGLNSVMYIFWWSKPRDVRAPVVIRTRGAERALGKRLDFEDITLSFSQSELDFHKDLIEDAKTLPNRFTSSFSQVWNSFSRSRKGATNEKKIGLAMDEERVSNSQSSSQDGNRTKVDITLFSPRYELLPYPPMTQSGNTILKKSAKYAIKSASLPFYCLLYIIDLALLIPIVKILKYDTQTSLSRSFFSGSSFNIEKEDEILSMIFYSVDADVKPLLTTSSIAGVIFGAVHCIAWNFSFPSYAQQIMWRTASLGVIGSCFMSLVGVYVWDDFATTVNRLFGKWANLILIPVLIFVFLLYPVARITLLVLGATSLGSLPPGAFHTVDWAEFVPHI